MIDFRKKFETDQILLRPLEVIDKEAMGLLPSEKHMWTYFTSDLSEPNVLSSWIDNSIEDIRKSKRLALAIIAKQTNTIIGSTSLGNLSERDKRAEIGWTWICKDFQGKGINDQAKFLLLDYCFEELNLARVEFKTDVLNLPARNALKRIGATEEGVLRSHSLMTNNRRRDTIYFSILSKEWTEIKKKFGLYSLY